MHERMGARVAQGGKMAEVSTPERPIWGLLVKSIVIKYFAIVLRLEPHLNLGPMGKYISEE